MLKVINLYRKQGDFELKNITFEVRKKEYFVILGPSGSGKTTILDCIAGLRKIHSGRILIDEQDVTYLPPEKRNVAYVFQANTLFPHMTVFGNIEYPLKVRGIQKEKRKHMVIEIAKKLGIEYILNKMPREISGGEARRVELARALVINPSVLLLDEPLAHLDEPLKKELSLELRKLRKEWNIPIVHVTHDQRIAFMLSDKIALLQDGRIVEIGDSIKLFLNPRKVYTAKFLGFENIFEGEVISCSDFGSVIDVHGIKFFVPEKAKGSVKIGFRPEDVIIFKELPTKTSLRNIFEGRITEIIPQGPVIMLEVDVGIPIKVLITRGSLETLKLGVGEKVFIGIKAAAIRILED